jgi:hypothetical protein
MVKTMSFFKKIKNIMLIIDKDYTLKEKKVLNKFKWLFLWL